MFGWSDEDTPTSTDADGDLMARAEALTDELVQPAYAALDEGAAADLVAGVEACRQALT